MMVRVCVYVYDGISVIVKGHAKTEIRADRDTINWVGWGGVGVQLVGEAMDDYDATLAEDDTE